MPSYTSSDEVRKLYKLQHNRNGLINIQIDSDANYLFYEH